MSKRILMVIAPDQFRDEELQVPRDIFKAEGWQVDTVSTRTGPAKGMLGATENVQLTLDDIVPENYDAALVVGGMGSIEYLWDNAQLHGALKTVANARKVVGAICLSGAVLANAGLLAGKKATVWEMPESLAALKKGGASYTGEPCTVDGNVVTANGPEAAEKFGKSVTERVKALAAVR